MYSESVEVVEVGKEEDPVSEAKSELEVGIGALLNRCGCMWEVCSTRNLWRRRKAVWRWEATNAFVVVSCLCFRS